MPTDDTEELKPAPEEIRFVETIIVPIDITAKAMVAVRCPCCGNRGKIDECFAPGGPPA